MNYFNIPERPLEPPEDRRRVCYTCKCCGEDIREGDEYLEIPNFGALCEECAHYARKEAE